jgi:hypothetical protein
MLDSFSSDIVLVLCHVISQLTPYYRLDCRRSLGKSQTWQVRSTNPFPLPNRRLGRESIFAPDPSTTSDHMFLLQSYLHAILPFNSGRRTQTTAQCTMFFAEIWDKDKHITNPPVSCNGASPSYEVRRLWILPELEDMHSILLQ